MSKKRGKVKIKEYLNKPKKPTKKIGLKQVLHDIYYRYNLETTCNGVCECCKVACPSMNFCEYSQLINEVWKTTNKSEKIELICKSVEYFFYNQFEKFGMKTLIKPCMLLSKEGKCKWYDSRPLNCRLYGLWPITLYRERVDKFEKAYSGLLSREQLPLNTQCPYVKRKDESQPLTKEIIEELFTQLDMLDTKIGNFSEIQMKQKENYRTFHDWLLLKIFGESKLADLTDFMIAASGSTTEDMINVLEQTVRTQFEKDMPESL